MAEPLNRSEKFTFELCTCSFLSPWCFHNPSAKKGKELCDVLVVCGPDVVLFSVKEVSLADPNDQVQHDRWQRKAVDASVNQLYGASNWLTAASDVIHADGVTKIILPPIETRRLHRVAVACGGGGKCFISSGDLGKGYVHVYTEQTLYDVLTELDTITDFVRYLSDKESFLANQCSVHIDGGSEADLLGLYLHGHRMFPENADLMMISGGIWDRVRSTPEFIARKKQNLVSYKWDFLIERLAGKEGQGSTESSSDANDLELIVRNMAREDRFCRRQLSDALLQFLDDAKAGHTRSRVMCSPSQSLYVFVYFSIHEEREDRLTELYDRCLVARSKFKDARDVVTGIGFNPFIAAIGSAIDAVHVTINTGNDRWLHDAQIVEDEFGYFRGQTMRSIAADEFPELES